MGRIMPNFYPRSPCGERRQSNHSSLPMRDFYPRSPCGERRKKNGSRPHGSNFYPRSPCGERPTNQLGRIARILISIHALLAESDHYKGQYLGKLEISIHALLAESDPCCQYTHQWTTISIHALLAESDVCLHPSITGCCDFYPRSPCGERQESPPCECLTLRFLSTLSLRRATANQERSRFLLQEFLSTLSLRRATALRDCISCTITISIHALLAESDMPMHSYSAPPVISIHALLAESDSTA